MTKSLFKQSGSLGGTYYCWIWFSQNSNNTTNKSTDYASIGIWCCCHCGNKSWRNTSWRYCHWVSAQQILYEGASLVEDAKWRRKMGFKLKVPTTISLYLLACVEWQPITLKDRDKCRDYVTCGFLSFLFHQIISS
jgi:hypothetical protein